MSVRRAAASIVCALLFVPTAFAQDGGSALMNEALDKPIDLELDTTLPQAVKAIADKTGVPVRLTPAALDMLPWGEQTKLTVSVANQTLRQALAAVCSNLGLRFIVNDEAVELRPIPALTRVARRCTVEELNAIGVLAGMKYPDTPSLPTMEKVAADIDAGLSAAKSIYAVDGRVTDDVAKQTVRLPRAASYLAALEEMNRQTRATWYPSGKSIVVVQKEQLVQNLLSRPVTMRFNGVDVAQVLTELARRSGVEFTIEPGAVQRIAPESRVIKLVLENASTRQALESISGFTGLHYVQSDTGVYVWNPAAMPVPRKADRVVCTVPLDDGTQLLLSESELPADVREYLDAKRSKTYASLREQMKKDGFKPTTKPAE